jgi:hypothetical protein
MASLSGRISISDCEHVVTGSIYIQALLDYISTIIITYDIKLNGIHVCAINHSKGWHSNDIIVQA